MLDFKYSDLKVSLSAIFFLLTLWFADTAKAQSVLASGDWYKIGVVRSGAYKIDYSDLLAMGMAVSSLNPQYLALYGNALNGMLPQLNSDQRPQDLLENAIWVSGAVDGKFDPQDFILFYGKSPNHLSYDPATNRFDFKKNLYSDTAFYFLTIKSSPGKRIQQKASTPLAASLSSSGQTISIHELDKNNLVNSGREWFGEQFGTGSMTHQVSFSSVGIVNASPVVFTTRVLSKDRSPSSFRLSLGGNLLGTIKMRPVSKGRYVTQADEKTQTFSVNSLTLPTIANTLDLSITFVRTENYFGYLDYVRMQAERTLDMSKKPISWFAKSTDAGFSLRGAGSQAWVWDVTRPVEPVKQAYNPSAHGIAFTKVPNTKHFIAFNSDQALQMASYQKIKNQNLHGLAASDGIIITHPNFLPSAQRLARFRTAQDGITMEVVTVDQIYNEYASGAQDVTALRDFVKDQYNRHHHKLKYLLLFGDCSFDYKNRITPRSNFVPVYETRNSWHPIESFSSDDYYGFLEVNEGQWEENIRKESNHTLEIGIGRIPIRTNAEGEEVVNKIIRYQTSKLGYGPWRNHMAFTADDGDANLYQEDSEKIIKAYRLNTRFNVSKVYLDAYSQPQNRSPEAAKAFVQAITGGNLIVNFIGHGNQTRLTEESMFTQDMIKSLKNSIKMPLFVAGTCDFGNYDGVKDSAGEQMVLLPYGGAIALVTATRPVFANTNYLLDSAFFKAALKKENGQYRRLGDMFKDTKNNSFAGINNRNYALLGDPTLRLNFPRNTVELTHINGKSVNQIDTLRALGRYTFSGEVQQSHQIDPTFHGKVWMTVYGQPAKFRTRGDQGTRKMLYEINEVRLFQGQATVKEGKFSLGFIVPKNINYAYSKGKVSFYTLNRTRTVDAGGYFSDVVVGGSVKVANPDLQAPKARLYINDTTFKSGQEVGMVKLFLAQLSDLSGINISSAGFSDEILFYLDDQKVVSLNAYYTASLDTYQKGIIRYPLQGLKPGYHKIKLEVSDVFNNQTTDFIDFFVSGESSIRLTNLVSYPNPVDGNSSETTIVFEHDRLGEDLTATLTITDLDGQEILSNTYLIRSADEKRLSIKWDLSAPNSSRVSQGMYIYVLKIQSHMDGAKGMVFGKIIILS